MQGKRARSEEDDLMNPTTKRARSVDHSDGQTSTKEADESNHEEKQLDKGKTKDYAKTETKDDGNTNGTVGGDSPRKRAKVDDNARRSELAYSPTSRSPRNSDAANISNDAAPAPTPKSPPRQRKRPGGASRITQADREAARHRQLQREQELANLAKVEGAARGVQDVVKQHYNAQPERGREWRRTDSKIKGLRNFNNWVKSVLVHKFSPNEDYVQRDSGSNSNRVPEDERNGWDERGILVLDVGCGKGGDLQKWNLAPQKVDLYVGLDPAEISITQARERYDEMVKRNRPSYSQNHGRGRSQGQNRGLYQGEFIAKDCFGEWIGDVPIVREVGIDPSIGPDGDSMQQRWGTGGFDVVSMMFCMHYAFENESKARRMLKNVAGSLRKGGRFLGVIPNSDILSTKVEEFHRAQNNDKDDAKEDDWDPEKPAESTPPPKTAIGNDEPAKALEWGNSIYRVKFPGKTPSDGVFRPPFGWKYFYFLEEAIAEIPEYVVPWEAFRALAEDYNLELQYRKGFNEIWYEERNDRVLGMLSERMGVRERGRGRLLVSNDEFNAASFYHAFCFYKV